MEADLGINQRLLCGRNSTAVRGGNGELRLDRCAAFDQPQGDGAKLEMPCRAADKTHRTPIQLKLCARSRQGIDAAVKMQAHEAARRPAEVVDPGNGFLAAVATLVQMDGYTEQADLVRDSSVVGVKADPRHAGGNPAGL